MSESDFLPLGQARALTDSLSGTAAIDPKLTRTNYFDGRLLRARDLTRDQMYLDFRLREYGKSLGSGVVRGLTVAFDDLAGERFTLSPGVGITRAGRTIETPEIRVELSRETLNELNPGAGFHLDRGLYALVISHAELPIRIAEVFPRDLTLASAVHPDVIADAVQVGLAPLPVPLPQDTDVLRARAQVAAALFRSDALAAEVPEDGVALGVVAIAEDRVIWVDADLLRRRVHENPLADQRKRELARHYEAVFGEVEARRAGGAQAFQASQYFRLLPPAGSLPKSTIDPQQATQSYFPENVDVQVAPILANDLALAMQESMALPPLDLLNTEPVELLVLVPLSAADFAAVAGELRLADGGRRMPDIETLVVRLQRFRTTHDQALWNRIFGTHADSRLHYVRRPMRAAETHISGILLAQGVDLPPAGPGAGAVPDVDVPVIDELAILEAELGIARLNELRPATTQAARVQQRRLAELIDTDPQLLPAVIRALVLIDRRYDPVLWETLFRLAQSETLEAFIRLLISAPDTPASRVVEDNRAELGIAQGLADRWVRVDRP